jgi:plasmid stability protein
MASIKVRNLPEETCRALHRQAACNGVSAEAEALAILERALRPEGSPKLGSLLAQIGRDYGGKDFHVERDKTPAKPPAPE